MNQRRASKWRIDLTAEGKIKVFRDGVRQRNVLSVMARGRINQAPKVTIEYLADHVDTDVNEDCD